MSVALPIQLFSPTAVTAANITLYTAPTAPATQLLRNAELSFVNQGAVAHELTVYIVPKGGSADITNIYIDAVSIGNQKTFNLVIPTLSESEKIIAKIDAAPDTDVVAHSIKGTLWTP